MDTLTEMLAENLRSLRAASKLTQGKLAELAETSQPQIKRLESGERAITRFWAERLAAPLKTQPVNIVFPDLDIQADKVSSDKDIRTLLRRIDKLPEAALEPLLVLITGYLPRGEEQQPPQPHGQSEPANHHHG